MTRLAAATGGLVLLAAWAGPLPGLAATSFTAHMVLHMVVVAVAAPILAVAIAGSRVDPVRWAPRLCSPLPASGVELAAVWAWHVPALHHAARTSGAAFTVEQLSFLAAGLLFWASVIGGPLRVRRANAAPALAALSLTLAHMTLLAVLLSLSPRPLYRHGLGLDHEALRDQQRGGAVMFLMSAAACVAGALVVGRRLTGAGAQAGWRDA